MFTKSTRHPGELGQQVLSRLTAAVLLLWIGGALVSMMRPAKGPPDLFEDARTFVADMSRKESRAGDCAPPSLKCASTPPSENSADREGASTVDPLPTTPPTREDLDLSLGEMDAVIDFYVDKLASLARDLDALRCEMEELRRRRAEAPPLLHIEPTLDVCLRPGL